MSTLVVREAGGDLIIDLVWGLDCSLAGTGSTVFIRGNETGEKNERNRSLTLIQVSWVKRRRFQIRISENRENFAAVQEGMKLRSDWLHPVIRSESVQSSVWLFQAQIQPVYTGVPYHLKV